MGDWYTYEKCAAFIAYGKLGTIIRAAMEQKNSLVVAKRDSISGDYAAAAVVLEVEENSSRKAKFHESYSLFKAKLKNMWVDGISSLLLTYMHRKEFAGAFQKISIALASVAPHHPKQTHWYILALGTVPKYQGNGLGKELIEQISTLADQAERTIYLECGETNKGFYEKMGYTCKAGNVVQNPLDPKGAPLKIYAMVRSPKSTIKATVLS